MGLVTIGKNARVYRRAFDHDEAILLRKQGWSYVALAEKYGVTPQGVARVCDPRIRARYQLASNEWHRGHRAPCKGACGKLVWLTTHPQASGYCPTCNGLRIARSVREDTLYCSMCGEWKPDEDFSFYRRAKARRGRHHDCRQCQTIRRRESRARERERANA